MTPSQSFRECIYRPIDGRHGVYSGSVHNRTTREPRTKLVEGSDACSRLLALSALAFTAEVAVCVVGTQDFGVSPFWGSVQAFLTLGCSFWGSHTALLPRPSVDLTEAFDLGDC
jgi:hypothetical protein